MTKYIASIFIIAAVLCCSSLAYPFRDSGEFYPTDEGKLRRDEDNERESHEVRHGAFWNDEATLRRNEKKDRSSNNKAPSSKRFKRDALEVDAVGKKNHVPYFEAGEKLVRNMMERSIVAAITVASVKESLREELRKKITNRIHEDLRWNSSLEDFIAFCARKKVEAEFGVEIILYPNGPPETGDY